jgi:DNA-binding CsgD family transcriptional regulator
MGDAEQLSLLIGEIYDTTLDPARWTEVLEKIVGFMQGTAAVLASEDIGGGAGSFYYSWGDDPEYSELYRAKFSNLNPSVVPIALTVRPGEVCSISTVVPYDEFLQSRLYKEWVKPQNYGDVTTVLIEKSAKSFAHLAVAHHGKDSPAEENARKRMRLLAPHICRAVAISKIIELRTIEAAMLAGTIDALAAGVFLLQVDGHIAHANTSGKAILKEGQLFQQVNGAIQSSDLQARPALHAAIVDAAQGDSGLGGQGIAIPLMSRDGERYVAHILPLTSGARRKTGHLYRAVVAMFVHKASQHRPTLVEAVAKQFRLTPSELRVLFAIIEVGGVPQVADVLGISLDTVKTHLKRVFAKTGTKRQVDLVKLVVGYTDPLI